MKTRNYKAILFHPESDFVTDFTEKKTKQDVWNEIAEMGSRWIFYPIPFVATDKRIVDTPEGLEFLKGKAIKTVKKYLADNWKGRADEICNDMNAGIPLSIIYHH